MQSETKYTKQDLETMRAWSLQRKIQVTQTRIIEWIGRYDWNVYISFSGGKDSTVLADLTARAYQAFWCPNRKEPLHCQGPVFEPDARGAATARKEETQI